MRGALPGMWHIAVIRHRLSGRGGATTCSAYSTDAQRSSAGPLRRTLRRLMGGFDRNQGEDLPRPEASLDESRGRIERTLQ
jgi:hypothetical protein